MKWSVKPLADVADFRLGKMLDEKKNRGEPLPYLAAVFACYLVRLRLTSKLDGLIAGVFVASADYKSYVQSRVGGAAQPNANAKVLSGAEILVPPGTIQRVFREIVEPLLDQREILELQNQRLRAARDLRLPRLMSGEIAA